MADLRKLLRHKDFWRAYQQDPEAEDQYEIDMEIYEPYETEPPYDDTPGSILIQLPCSPRYRLELDVTFLSSSIYLGLVNTETSTRRWLGQWEGGWGHLVLALRWDELAELVELWTRFPALCPLGAQTALLLLARFVANGADEQEAFEQRRRQVEAAYQSLGLFSAREITQLVARTLFEPRDDDYRWMLKPGLGWTFGGEYPDYTTRSADHPEGPSSFPFADFAQCMQEVRAQLKG